MKFSKFIIIPIIIAILSALIQIVDQLISTTTFFSTWSGFVWIAFQSWALYFLAGCNIKGAVKSLIGYFIGASLSISIIYLGGVLTPHLGFWGLPVTLLILVTPIICLERVPWLSFIPSIFIGSGVFFAIITYVPETTLCTALAIEMVYCAVGLTFGFLSILLRRKYEVYVERNNTTKTNK